VEVILSVTSFLIIIIELTAKLFLDSPDLRKDAISFYE
jgi:hypothetical protein